MTLLTCAFGVPVLTDCRRSRPSGRACSISSATVQRTFGVGGIRWRRWQVVVVIVCRLDDLALLLLLLMLLLCCVRPSPRTHGGFTIFFKLFCTVDLLRK